MGGLTIQYVLRRFGIFLMTIWLASTVIFVIPRLAPGDPIQAMVSRMTQSAGYVENSEKIVEGWKERFGLNDPLHVQYVRYIKNLASLDLGVSLAMFPTTVKEVVGRAMPWSIGLMSISLVLYFFIGNLFGAILAWKRTPSLAKIAISISMIFTSIPGILCAIILIYLFAFNLDWFPFTGSFERGMQPAFTWEFISSVIYYGILPALSVVLVTFGFWTIGMRGMMVTVEGEDYMIFGQAKGLKPFYLLYRYQVRNAILPQITALAFSIGSIVAGQILVEAAFAYRGMGGVIVAAIKDIDYTVIQGTSFILILITATSVLILDLIYPLIDPRITFQKN
jgi:peptide/nickel transport system permease protein